IFLLTKETRFLKGAGPDGEAAGVNAGQLAETFRKGTTVTIRYYPASSKVVATEVSAVLASPRLPRVEPGQSAPNFTLPATQIEQVLPGKKDADTFSLKDLRGKNVVLFFFPTATAPGCAEQCRGFRDLLPEFRKLDTVILGVSTDGPKALEKLAEEAHLNFPL